MTFVEQSQGYSASYWCPVDSSENARPSESDTSFVDGALWVALLKMSNGEVIAPAEQEWLVAQSLVEVVNGTPNLTERGRAALGVSL